MSSDFKNKKLREVIDLVIDNRGKNPKEYSSSGIPVIDNYLITSDGQVNLNEVKRFIDENTYNTFLRKYVQFGDVLMTLVGNGYGKVAITPKEKCAIIQNTVGFRCNNENCNKFLYYLLRSNREFFMNLNRGAAQPSIKVGDILELEFEFPSKAHQERISSILGALDDRIALLRETNATLEAIAQALFKSWFVDFDPVHANAGTQAPSLPAEIQALFPSLLVESPQGLIPEGWEWGAISDYAKLNPESWTAKKHPATVAYIDLANAKDNVIADIAEFVFADAPSRARRVLKDRDTIVGTVRPGNRSFAFIYDAASNLTGSTGFAVLRPKHPRNTAFIYLAATNDSSIDHLTHVADGGAYPAVRPDVVAGLTCVRAPADVLEAFNEVSEELLCKISKNHSLAQTLSDLRDTLLPRLISGQLRLPEAEAVLAEVV